MHMARVKKSRKNDPSYKRHKSNASDTQRIIPIVSLTPSSTTKIGRTDRLLSGLNHRLYRQHGAYNIKIDLLSSAEVPSIRVYTLATTWWTKRSIQMAKQIHDIALEEERAMTPGARWYDFRIDDNSGTVDELVTDLRDVPGAPSSPVTHPGEYAFSQIEDTAGNSREFRLIGATSPTGWNIFDEYDALGNTARDPDQPLPAGSGYDGADATLDGQNISHLNNKGDLPPYDGTDFSAQKFREVANLYRHSNGNQRLSTGFFEAPLGMFWVVYGSADQAIRLQLECKAGKYKGVHMEAY
uniref:Uncharacterized protein n=1 Tax=uncultured marine virus TaxID=186617 RepID=S4TF30_9VIRU|nr:hypothetical protein [uncultured marine virus]